MQSREVLANMAALTNSGYPYFLMNFLGVEQRPKRLH